MGVARGDAAAPSCYMEGWQLRAYVLLRMDWDTAALDGSNFLFTKARGGLAISRFSSSGRVCVAALHFGQSRHLSRSMLPALIVSKKLL